MDVVLFSSLVIAAFGGLVILGLSFEPQLAGRLKALVNTRSEEQAMACFLSVALVVLATLMALQGAPG